MKFLIDAHLPPSLPHIGIDGKYAVAKLAA